VRRLTFVQQGTTAKFQGYVDRSLFSGGIMAKINNLQKNTVFLRFFTLKRLFQN
jgi:hypothetical protein